MSVVKAIVLSSGGIDSTTCLATAVDMYGADNVVTLTCFYGQKHKKEIECARRVAKHYGVRHFEIDLSPVYKFSDCPLLEHSSKEIIHKSYAQQIQENGEGMVETYVPFRNGLMLSSVAALAVSIFPGQYVGVYLGAHADDSAGQAYADCSPEFTATMGEAIYTGTYGKVSLIAPFVNMTKAEVVKTGIALNAPYHLTWSCYEGKPKPCGKCGTCIDRAAAFKANNAIDPIL